MEEKLDFLQSNNYKDLQQYVNRLLDTPLESRNELLNIANFLYKDNRKNMQKLSEKISVQLEKLTNEIKRVKALYDFDSSFREELVAGVDEVGRGPLAGPIVAAAVILKQNYEDDKELLLYINDSKKLSSKVREELAELIKEKAVSYSIASLDNNIIDQEGIGYCNNEIFKIACAKLSVKPQLVLSDGYSIKNFNIRNEYVIKGDTNSASIACASIIAKVYRDKLMYTYDVEYPQYGFSKHVGYGTKEHIESLLKFGITPIHRRSFLRNILEENR
jgi:ribonuclease HII